ncbi:hypothetical protein [Streptomyces sp. NPDC054837]
MERWTKEQVQQSAQLPHMDNAPGSAHQALAHRARAVTTETRWFALTVFVLPAAACSYA